VILIADLEELELVLELELEEAMGWRLLRLRAEQPDSASINDVFSTMPLSVLSP